MRLQQKFALLFAVLGLTAAINVGVAVWAIRFLERELAWPLESISEVMSGLYEMKRAVEDESAAIGFLRGSGALISGEASERTDQSRARFQAAELRIEQSVRRLEGSPSYLMRSGVGTTRNLRDRAERLRALGASWFDEGDDAVRSSLGHELGSTHELIERLEGRILRDTSLAVEHSERLRTLVLGLVVVTIVVVLLVGVLAVSLVRRWVVTPVEALRVAAARIGSGDLEHRLTVVGSDELAELSSEVNHMAFMLAQLHDERIERERLAAVGEMTRRIVHNLRRPLSGIRALAETTRTELPADSDLVGVQDRIMRAVDRFEEWLRDVLRAASPLDLQVSEVEIRPWIKAQLEAHEPEAETKRVTIELDDADAPDRAVFDSHHLGHALSAVLTNAIDFSPEGRTVGVEIGSENSMWWIRVSDSGPGIPAEDIEEVFRPYMTTRATGTGIGLAIAKRVLEQHGGTIRVLEPQNGDSGTVFEMRLGVELANDGHVGGSIGQDSGH